VKTCKKEQFSILYFESNRGRERCYADHIFIQIYFRLHHFAVNFSKFSSPRAARGQALTLLPKSCGRSCQLAVYCTTRLHCAVKMPNRCGSTSFIQSCICLLMSIQYNSITNHKKFTTIRTALCVISINHTLKFMFITITK